MTMYISVQETIESVARLRRQGGGWKLSNPGRKGRKLAQIPAEWSNTSVILLFILGIMISDFGRSRWIASMIHDD